VRDRRAHIKVSRRFFEEDAWWREPRKFSRAEAWLDLIQMASWKPRKFAVGLTVEELARGEFMASIRFLAKRWRWSKSAVDRFLLAVQKAGRIARQREGQDGTVYILVKYSYYQGGDTESGTPPGTETGTAAGQQRDKTEASKAGKAEKPSKTTWLTPFAAAWSDRCGNPPFGRLARQLAPLRDQLGEPEALARWTRYLAVTEPRYCSPERFVATHAAYTGPERLEMTDEMGEMRLHTKRDGWWGYERDGEWVRTVEVGQVSA
jgi:hypothetical protein